MFQRVNYQWRPGQPFSGVTISPTGEAAVIALDGDIDLFPQASRVFGQLARPNTFTGQTNTFCDVVARRIHVTSDADQKTNLRPLSDRDAEDLVRRIVPYHYLIDGRMAAGVLAQDVPEVYASRTPGGTLVVDYTSLLAELWGAVRHLSHRLDALTGCAPGHPPDAACCAPPTPAQD